MSIDQTLNSVAQPPVDVPDIQRGDWLALPASDPVVQFLDAQLWSEVTPPSAWEVARLSPAVYVYRETITHWAVVAKFYAVKTGEKAKRYARREFECTQRAREALSTDPALRAVAVLATWRGVLFLEYVDGLTLEDTVAVRRSRPGTLNPSLEGIAQLLVTLHTQGVQPDAAPDFEAPAAYARELVHDLVRWGVLESDPVVRDSLNRLIDQWAREPAMAEFSPVLSHGDATTSNFVFPWTGGVVAVDWERLEVADPAADLGRLMAELGHSINQHGGSVAEAVPFVGRLAGAYRQALPGMVDADALLARARFYQASSSLRIARNGWVSKLDRMALVAHALALLSK